MRAFNGDLGEPPNEGNLKSIEDLANPANREFEEHQKILPSMENLSRMWVGDTHAIGIYDDHMCIVSNRANIGAILRHSDVRSQTGNVGTANSECQVYRSPLGSHCVSGKIPIPHGLMVTKIQQTCPFIESGDQSNSPKIAP